MFFLKELPTEQMVAKYTQHLRCANATQVLEKLRALRSASLLIRDLDEYFGRHGLSQLRFLILIVIDREIERKTLSHGEIVQRLDVSKPVMTRSLQSLVDDGLVSASRSEIDARSKSFALTASGQQTLQDVLPGYFAILVASPQKKGKHEE